MVERGYERNAVLQLWLATLHPCLRKGGWERSKRGGPHLRGGEMGLEGEAAVPRGSAPMVIGSPCLPAPSGLHSVRSYSVELLGGEGRWRRGRRRRGGRQGRGGAEEILDFCCLIQVRRGRI